MIDRKKESRRERKCGSEETSTLVSAVIRRKKGNGPGPSAASAIQAFVLMVCFHWQQAERGLQNRQRCEDEDKSTETKEEPKDIFLYSDAKKITNIRERGRCHCSP